MKDLEYPENYIEFLSDFSTDIELYAFEIF